MIIPSIVPETTMLFSFSVTELTSFVIVSIAGIVLSISVVSIEDPEPMFIVGLPLRSDLT